MDPNADDQDIAPRPRAGFRSARELPIATRDKANLMASAIRGVVGVVCLGAAQLFVPPHVFTPIMTGVALVMIVTGAYGCWTAQRDEPRLRRLARPFVWLLPLASVGVLVFAAVVGPGRFGFRFEDMRPGPPEVRFQGTPPPARPAPSPPASVP